ncbi:6-phosphofructokinase [Verrucomicrobiaceae bacterium R5-34]|uniref:6-phosphofructokinase n=1 Tax=Oceaniferula flava TaxID=2800421 RepID=A0AAE2SDI5_9BACT|nr:6-phosphofructokinase [Oceaniferula flavus]MBK1831329.1 6-phosphofructokinase [Verrucomicrobiaceae bacterium R5-34]MBK1855002.1 6-phosphofructokinase [Oceaniferula flavus]MBM1136308.1 6-phosphofructokinase [Oceaniferula flavus]
MEGIAIMTSGGDAAGMNPAIKAAADHAMHLGYEPFLVDDGLRGLIDDKIEKVSDHDVSDIIHRGGTILRSSRSKRFFEYEHRLAAYENLKKRGIEKLVVIGGDGSFRALNQFYADFQVPFAGIPATIDNDIPGTDYCLGVDTALNMIRQSVDSIRDTANSFRRAFVVETMGRHCGYLAMASAVTSGAEICMVPELEYDLDSIGERLRVKYQGHPNFLIAIVAEGCNMSDYLNRWIGDTLKMDSRLTILGHIQRGGSPTVRDRLMASKFAVGAVESLHRGETCNIMIYKSGHFGTLPIHKVADSQLEMDPALVAMCKKLCK